MGASSGSNTHNQHSPNMLPPRQLPWPSGLHPSLFLAASDTHPSSDPQDRRSNSDRVRDSPTESASSQETWPTARTIMAKKLENEKAENDYPEQSVIRRFSNSDKISLRDIARERVDIISERMHLLPDEFLEKLKGGLRLILDGGGGSQHREEFMILQKLVQSRSDLTAKTLIRAHRVQLEILVAINTGIQAFLHPSVTLSQTSLIEVFVYKRCRNMVCQNQLPADECTCDICTNRKGFCNLCMCVICNKFDFEVNTCRWIGCDMCSHWTHTDCAIRDKQICMGSSTKIGSGPAEMLFRCRACNRTSELLGWVKDVFQHCAPTWDREALSRELDFVSRIFRGSEDPKGRKLFWKCEELVEKLKNGVAESLACRVILMFFQELEMDSPKNPESGEGGRLIAPQEACNRISDVVQEAVRKMEMVADEKMRLLKKARLSLEVCDRELEDKAREVTELKLERHCKKQQIDELESIVRLKQAEADMFQLKANEARREAERLQSIALARSEKSEEEYASRYLKQRLSEAEAERQYLFEKIKLQESSRAPQSNGVQYISKLVKIYGITIAASRTKVKATYVTLLCKNCKNVKTVACRPGLGGAIVPRSCDHMPQAGEEPCPIDPWIVVPDKSKYVDQQTLKLQENPEDVPTGELPRNMLLSVDRHLVQTIVPGTRLTIMGIYSIFQAANSSSSHKGAVAIRQPYIRVVGIEQTNEANSRGPANFTVDEIEEFKKFASEGNAYENICSKIAPSIFGHVDVKKAVACLLFGGSRKVLPDGVKLRGDINVLLLGDPSTAKSQFLKFVEKTAPVAVYTSGKGSSAAGLTASVIQDNSSREFYLEGGAMVLADGGVVCIDEFDKMRAEDRVAIHEAMEQQTISIAKAGITTVLNSRTSVLAAANPPSGRYDDLKTAQDNIDLQTTILSRFDLIFIVKDIRMFSQDKNIASHIIKIHSSANAATGNSRTSKEDNWLKRYIQYCRTVCHPRLSDSAATLLQESYVKIRQDMRRQANENGESAAVPITVRQLEAIVRLSEALAKMKLSHVANDNHVMEAIRLFNNATMDAARSGINQQMNLTPEMANEIKKAETQIKRRMGIGSHISERRLIDELARMGINESIVRRALIIMHQREEVEYKRERRVILRKA